MKTPTPQLSKEEEKLFDEMYEHNSGDEYNNACPGTFDDIDRCDCQYKDIKQFIAESNQRAVEAENMRIHELLAKKAKGRELGERLMIVDLMEALSGKDK